MRLTKKQRRSLELVEFFVPDGYDGGDDDGDAGGVSAEEAFFAFTDRGVTSERVRDVRRYRQLLVGHARIALHRTMWEEGFREGTLFMRDFGDEPQVVKDLARRTHEQARQ